MAKNKKKVVVSNKGDFEYKMTKEMADAYLLLLFSYFLP